MLRFGLSKSFCALGLACAGLGLQSGRFAPTLTPETPEVRLAGSTLQAKNLFRNRRFRQPQLRSESEMRAYALDLVNQDRQTRGLPPLVTDPVAERAAQFHAQDMLRRRFFDHSSPEGAQPRQRYVSQGGGSVQLIGENIFLVENYGRGLTYNLAQYLQQGWMGNPGHRDLILTRDFRGFGYGITTAPNGKVYAVQVFTTGR
jgi:uncharacterized protein YkwD